MHTQEGKCRSKQIGVIDNIGVRCSAQQLAALHFRTCCKLLSDLNCEGTAYFRFDSLLVN